MWETARSVLRELPTDLYGPWLILVFLSSSWTSRPHRALAGTSPPAIYRSREQKKSTPKEPNAEREGPSESGLGGASGVSKESQPHESRMLLPDATLTNEDMARKQPLPRKTRY